MAEWAPSEKQVAEAEERTEKENPGKAYGAALWWEKTTQKANGGDKNGGMQKKKKKGDERVANNMATVVKEG